MSSAKVIISQSIQLKAKLKHSAVGSSTKIAKILYFEVPRQQKRVKNKFLLRITYFVLYRW